MFLEFLTVAALASFEIYAAIPAGYVFGLSPWLILLASITGGLAGVFVAAFLGDSARIPHQSTKIRTVLRNRHIFRSGRAFRPEGRIR